MFRRQRQNGTKVPETDRGSLCRQLKQTAKGLNHLKQTAKGLNHLKLTAEPSEADG